MDRANCVPVFSVLIYLLTGPPGPPEAPQVSDVFKTSAVLTWRAPTDDGGTPVTAYWIERRLTSSVRWVTVNKDAITDLTYTVKDLVEGSEYEFRVTAENKAGRGPPSAVSQPVLAKDPWGKFTLYLLT